MNAHVGKHITYPHRMRAGTLRDGFHLMQQVRLMFMVSDLHVEIHGVKTISLYPHGGHKPLMIKSDPTLPGG